ncbi:hypothetical protein POKO110462_01480 [Pontibacter korlensis]
MERPIISEQYNFIVANASARLRRVYFAAKVQF